MTRCTICNRDKRLGLCPITWFYASALLGALALIAAVLATTARAAPSAPLCKALDPALITEDEGVYIVRDGSFLDSIEKRDVAPSPDDKPRLCRRSNMTPRRLFMPAS